MRNQFASTALTIASPSDSRKRKRQLRIALALADTTQDELAAKWGVSSSHLSMVVSGKTVSAPVLAKVDAFIAQHVPAL